MTLRISSFQKRTSSSGTPGTPVFFLSRLFISRITLILSRALIIRPVKRKNINTSITVIKYLINLADKIRVIRNDIDETKRFVDL